MNELARGKGDKGDRGLESVDLVVSMLELLAAQTQPMSLGDVARGLAISKPRAHRHLRALGINGYVVQGDDDRYGIGARLIQLADTARSRMTFAVAARPAMTALRDATGQAVTAATLIGGNITVVELINGRTIVQFAVRPGTTLHPARSAHGLVALSLGKIDAGNEPVPEGLLCDIRARGWAVAPGLIMTGVNALAAPVFDPRGEWVGSIALVGSIDHIPALPDPALIEQVQQAASEISKNLAWSTWE